MPNPHLVIEPNPRMAMAKRLAAWLLAAGLGAAASAGYTSSQNSTAQADALATRHAAQKAAGGMWQTCSSAMEASDANPSAQAATNPGTPQHMLEQLLHPTASASLNSADNNPYPTLLDQAHKSEAFRRDLLARFARETDPSALGHLAVLLSGAGTADITRSVSNMLLSPDATQRQRALLVLANLQGDDTEARQAIEGLIKTEADPDTLRRAVSLLSPGSGRTPQEAEPLTTRLQQLSQHESPAVRSAALLAMARWNAPSNDANLMGGLADPDPTVISAAIDAVGEAGLRNGAAMEALLRVAERQDLPAPVRQQALDSLNSVNLDAARHARLMQLQRDPSLSG